MSGCVVPAFHIPAVHILECSKCNVSCSQNCKPHVCCYCLDAVE